MQSTLLEAGKILGTHGVRGECKLEVWCDSPEFLARFPVLYIDGAPKKIAAARVHKGFLLVLLEGVCSVESAMALKNKIVYIHREDAALPDGSYFLADIIGFSVFDRFLERDIGRLDRILFLPNQDVYVVRQGEREWLIPAAGPFVEHTDFDSETLYVRTIEGMVEP